MQNTDGRLILTAEVTKNKIGKTSKIYLNKFTLFSGTPRLGHIRDHSLALDINVGGGPLFSAEAPRGWGRWTNCLHGQARKRPLRRREGGGRRSSKEKQRETRRSVYFRGLAQKDRFCLNFIDSSFEKNIEIKVYCFLGKKRFSV